MRKPVLKEAFDANGDLVPLDHSEAYSHVTSYNGEIVKLFSLWYGFLCPLFFSTKG
jgi:hypothetical protein